MPKGDSGRVVIEVSKDLKTKLYIALASDNNSTLKDWFVKAATSYIAEREQPSIPDLIGTNRGGAKKQ